MFECGDLCTSLILVILLYGMAQLPSKQSPSVGEDVITEARNKGIDLLSFGYLAGKHL